ncbi:MAG TPA: serine/threonine-protein kinase [Caulifigura sp.]|nr:serine/threonine-protein kinase [Caulifigura sp.]
MQLDRIGPYKLVRELGAGGMGTVYLGLDERNNGAQAAVKVLPASMARETGFVARFTREIDAMRTVHGPNIVELLDAGEDAGTWYYAMEFVDGETLTERLVREKRIPWREVIDIAIQICKALKAAHNAGVIHRDLKPSNLLLSKDGTIKLTDFGVAQVFASGKLTATGGVIGTVEYMSPEQAQGKRATKQSDIYGLGAVMYVMLTGRPPFTGKTALDIAQKHKYGQFDSPRRIVPEIPHWLDEIVCNCLQKKPEDRYPDAYVLQLRLQEIPKKLQLAQGDTGGGSGSTAAGPRTFNFDGAGADDVTQGDAVLSGDAPVGGTLMRDLVKGHLDKRTSQTPLEKLFDNTWVLVLVLAVVIAAGFLWLQSRRVSPDQLFARGQSLMNKAAGPSWEEARREVFEPLLALDRETWEPRIAPYLDQLALYDLRQEFLSPRSLKENAPPKSDVERILRRAWDERRRGELASSRETLNSLKTIAVGSPQGETLAPLIDELLATLGPAEKIMQENGRELLDGAVTRARQFSAEGMTPQARTVWTSIVNLYGGDPSAAKEVAEARAALSAVQEETPSATESIPAPETNPEL